jgi:hypothetical protein
MCSPPCRASASPHSKCSSRPWPLVLGSRRCCSSSVMSGLAWWPCCGTPRIPSALLLLLWLADWELWQHTLRWSQEQILQLVMVVLNCLSRKFRCPLEPIINVKRASSVRVKPYRMPSSPPSAHFLVGGVLFDWLLPVIQKRETLTPHHLCSVLTALSNCLKSEFGMGMGACVCSLLQI